MQDRGSVCYVLNAYSNFIPRLEIPKSTGSVDGMLVVTLVVRQLVPVHVRVMDTKPRQVL